jgi:hypothetical protein
MNRAIHSKVYCDGYGLWSVTSNSTAAGSFHIHMVLSIATEWRWVIEGEYDFKERADGPQSIHHALSPLNGDGLDKPAEHKS